MFFSRSLYLCKKIFQAFELKVFDCYAISGKIWLGIHALLLISIKKTSLHAGFIFVLKFLRCSQVVFGGIPSLSGLRNALNIALLSEHAPSLHFSTWSDKVGKRKKGNIIMLCMWHFSNSPHFFLQATPLHSTVVVEKQNNAIYVLHLHFLVIDRNVESSWPEQVKPFCHLCKTHPSKSKMQIIPFIKWHRKKGCK